ncbi:hypothetical protein FQ186_27930 [Pseudomonas sp. ANT_H14]|nr:hypothetical protein FQ182_29140 [Pseudomonas sp. ANT_H4]KAA0945899.1 hypothetical protein FQ186_27930 [Pseudomonas sp. ANT_H14]
MLRWNRRTPSFSSSRLILLPTPEEEIPSRYLLFILGAGSVLTAVAVFATLGRVSAHDHQPVDVVRPVIVGDRE